MAEEKKGLVSAISAAVTTYMKLEEEALSAASSRKGKALMNIWGVAGRQEIMEMRRLWQLRIPRP